MHHHADTLAAVVIEPLVQGAAGMITAPEGYLRRVREVTRQHDVLLIADEVAVGFGRTGTMFACEQEDVAPDFLCLAKGLTGGYLPLAATLTTDEVFDAFLGPPEAGRTFYHGHTYTGNPLGRGRRPGQSRFAGSTDRPAGPAGKDRTLAERTWSALRNFAIVGDVRQKGLLAGIELVRDRATKERFPATERMGARVLPPGARAGRVAASAGRRDRRHAAAGDRFAVARPPRRCALQLREDDGGPKRTFRLAATRSGAQSDPRSAARRG